MHTNNKLALNDFKKTYPEAFCGRVLELGSGSVRFAGTIRPWFNGCESYIGVDIEEGECVDIVGEAKNMKFESEYFDTIVSFSMLEHDFEWQLSLGNNLPFLKKGGTLLMCWGAEGNMPHMDVFRLVPHQEVLDFLTEHGMQICDAFFEEDRYGKDCAGAYDLVAKKI